MKKKKYIYDYDCGIYQIRNLLDGKENFVFEIIVLCEPDQLTYYEQSIKDINEGNCLLIKD